MSQEALLAQNWPAPAKINLFLHILGQRADGYHDLETVFQILDLCDWLTFSPLKEGASAALQLAQPVPGVPDSENLVVRAAQALLPYRRINTALEVSLRKTIPMGAGLGGGSSNAATALVALNKIWDCRLSKEELALLGQSLGADVPVFVHGGTAFAAGTGEKLLSVPKQNNYSNFWYLLIFPNCSISTAQIFSEKDLPRDTAPVNRDQVVINPFDGTRNDCEAVVREKYSEVDDALNQLSGFASGRMTGTGSTVFARFEHQEQAQRVAREMAKNWRVSLVQGLTSSPLQGVADNSC